MKKFLLSVLLAAGCVALHAETPMVRQTRFEGRNITGVVAGSSFNVEVYQSDTTRGNRRDSRRIAGIPDLPDRRPGCGYPRLGLFMEKKEQRIERNHAQPPK